MPDDQPSAPEQISEPQGLPVAQPNEALLSAQTPLAAPVPNPPASVPPEPAAAAAPMVESPTSPDGEVSVELYPSEPAASQSPAMEHQLTAPEMTVPPMLSGPAQPVVSGAFAAPASATTTRQRRMPKKWMLIAGVVAGIALIGGGAVFGLYLPNTPDGVFNAGLSNTGQMIDNLVSYTKTVGQTKYQSSDFTGALQVQSPSGSFDASMTGAADDKGNLTAQMATDIMGVKGSAALRSVHVADDSSPDVYFKITGIKRYLSSVGADSLDGLDGQWVLVDHTLLNTYASALTQSQTSSKTTAPTYAQLQDALARAQAVNRQYVFTTDSSKTVLQDQAYLGSVTDGSRTLNHYRVGYNRDHLKAYVTALAVALDQSTLNDWAKTTQNGKKISDIMQLSQLEQRVASAKTSYTFDVWIDTGTRLVSKLALTDPSDARSVFTISQAHISGSDYPVTMAMNGFDDSGNPQNATLTADVNTATNTDSFTLKAKNQDPSGTTTLDVSLQATPSMKAISVAAPTGAKSITDLLLGLDGGSSLGGASPLLLQQ